MFKKIAFPFLAILLLLMAAVFDNKDGMGCCMSAAQHCKQTETRYCGSQCANDMDRAAVVHCGIDVVSRFLTSDVPASEILDVAAQVMRVVEQRKGTLQSLSILLQTLTLSSVRQVLISTFVFGPTPIESHRTITRFSVLSNLSILRKESESVLREEVGKLFSYLISMLDTSVARKPADRAEVAMMHLVLQALHSLQLHPGDAEWLLNAGVVEKLCNVMVDAEGGYMTGASPSQLQDYIEHESLSGLRDAAFEVFAALTSNFARMASADSNRAGHIFKLLACAVAASAPLIKGASLYPSSETRDLLQLKILAWLNDIVAQHRPLADLIVADQSVRHALIDWALWADSPQVQRVAMKLLAWLFRNGGETAADANSSAQVEFLQMPRGENLVQALLGRIGAVMGTQGGSQTQSKEPEEVPDVAMRSVSESRSSKMQQWMAMVWPLVFFQPMQYLCIP